MTNKEAVKTLLTGMYRGPDGFVKVIKVTESDFLYAIVMAISLLMKQEEPKRLVTELDKIIWHDAVEDNPPIDGFYCVKLKSTGDIKPYRFEDNKWTYYSPSIGPSVCPKENICWADYTFKRN